MRACWESQKPSEPTEIASLQGRGAQLRDLIHGRLEQLAIDELPLGDNID